MCTGYVGTGVVEAVGADIGNFKVGDEVYFRGNDTMSLAYSLAHAVEGLEISTLKDCVSLLIDL